ncbi:MAG: methyl-accepting chemotaxis protein [Aquabacterium sp.]|nr:methyl-accepting chemotaxis protein [Aquabacterium sp.]
MFKSLTWKLAAMMLPAALSAVLLMVMALHNLSRQADAANATFVAKDVVADILPPPLYLIEMRLILSQALEQTISPVEADKAYQRLKGEYDARVSYWQANPPHGLERDLLGSQHTAALTFMTEARRQIIQPLLAGQLDVARAALPQVHALYLSHRQGVDVSVVSGTNMANDAIATMADISKQSPFVMLSLTAVLLTMAGGLFWTVSRKVISQVKQAADLADQVADGNLMVSVQAETRDEVGQLLEALNRMAIGLSTMVNEVRSSAHAIDDAANGIAQDSRTLSSRSEGQGHELSRAVESMTQMSSMVKHSTNTADQAKETASRASTVASQGGEAVHNMVKTMNEIQGSSQRISEIIGVIDGIAFQTNILALNAAVEAARAGEQGRGFAVVASEVRSLAQRSATAAREIKGLITSSVDKVQEGHNVVSQAGSTMASVVDHVQQVHNLIAQISDASQDQLNHIGQVHQAIHTLNASNHDNESLVACLSASADALGAQGTQMMAAVGSFQTKS